MATKEIPYFAVQEPFELTYKDGIVTRTVCAHTHNVAEVYLTLTDLPDVLLNQTVSQVRQGTLIVIPPFCVHQLFHRENLEYRRYILNVDVNWVEAVLAKSRVDLGYMKDAQQPLILSLGEEELERLLGQLDALVKSREKGELQAVAQFFTVLGEINSMVLERKREPGGEPLMVVGTQRRVNEIISYMNEHIMTGISVEEIAKHFYLNKDYLSRLFAKHTHTTIGHYMAMQRIAKAQELLREGWTVAQVQEMMGYSSYAHFFKTFQKMTGMSPSRYRGRFLCIEDGGVYQGVSPLHKMTKGHSSIQKNRPH